MTGRQLVAAIGRLRSGIDDKRRDELAERLQLDLGRSLRDLSSGNRRKIALLLAFASDAELMVLDEPTSGLDPLMQHVFQQLVAEARTAGKTVFLSSHVLSEVQRAADRVAVLRAGKIVAIGTVEELRGRARQRVEAWFVGDPPTAELTALPGIVDSAVDGRNFTAVLTVSIQPLIEVFARNPVSTMLVEEPDLEEAFLDLFAGDAGTSAPEGTAP